MTADPMPTPVPNRPQVGEQFFEQSIADLARRLDERKGGRAAPDLQAQAEARRRALQAFDRERARKFRLILGGAGAVVATVCIAWFVVLLGRPEVPPDAPTALASSLPIPESTVPPPAVTLAATTPAPEPLAPQPSARTELAPAADIPPPSPATEPQPDPREAAPALGREQIREVQKRLRAFGFNPGPVDGVAGRQTEIATQRYLEARGQPQLAPTDPDLLAQLRQDPAPPLAQSQIVQRPVQSDGWGKQASSQRNQRTQPQRSSFDPFEPVKVAGAEITRFLSSIFR